jgi:hypothetical protein
VKKRRTNVVGPDSESAENEEKKKALYIFPQFYNR